MFFNTYAVIDITSTDIRVVEVKRNTITKWDSARVPEGLVKDGIITSPESVSVIIDSLFTSLNLKKNRVACTLTGLPFIYRNIKMPGSEKNISYEAVERAARKEMSLMGEEMHLLWQAVKDHKDNEETSYFVLGVPKVSFLPLLETLRMVNIKPIFIGVKPLALARAASLDNVCVASLENNDFDIILVAGGLVRVIHSIRPAVNSDDLSGIVDEFVDGFDKAVKSFNRDFPQDVFTAGNPILLSGELAMNPEIVRLIQESTGHPTSVLKPLIDVPPAMPLARYMGSIGMILTKIQGGVDNTQYQDIRINLLTGAEKAGLDKNKLTYTIAGAVIVILAGLSVLFFNLKVDTAARVASLQQESVQAAEYLSEMQEANQSATAAVQSSDTRFQDLQAELSIVSGDNEQVINRKVDFASHLTAINEALPRNVDYDSIQMNAASCSITGTAETSYAIFNFTRNLEREDDFPVARVTRIEPDSDSDPDDPRVKFDLEMLK